MVRDYRLLSTANGQSGGYSRATPATGINFIGTLTISVGTSGQKCIADFWFAMKANNRVEDAKLAPGF